MIKQYLDILGVSETALEAEIKKAYRSRAKELHPDVNKAPDAHEKFLLLSEAYEYLLNRKTGKVYNPKKGNYTRPKQPYKSPEEWQREQRQQARKRAAHYANMRYERFKKTKYYESTEAIWTIIENVETVAAYLLVFGLPLGGYLFKEMFGLLFGLFVVLILAGAWVPIIFVEKRKFSPREIAKSLKIIFSRKTLYVVLAFATNVVLFYMFTINTVLNTWVLLILFLGLFVAGFFLFRKMKNAFTRRLLIWGLLPGIFNLLFVVNAVFSSDIKTERYSFIHHKQLLYGRYGGRSSLSQNTTLIYLEGDAYKNCIAMRFFLDIEPMEKSDHISYTFADGLFGLKVLKRYEFLKEE